jgi:Ca2+-binding RTX toxin-like protein
MATVLVQGSGTSVTLTYSSSETVPYANVLASTVSNGLMSGALTALPYYSGTVAPSAPGGVVIFYSTPSTPVEIPTQDVSVIIVGGPTTITGGGVGETVVAGSAGLNYTDITPSGSAVDYIAGGDGNNVISTSTTGSGNYQINTGAGKDAISVYGNGLINAGTGQNSISVAGGSSLIYSDGNDTINGSTAVGGGGTDTVDIGTDTVDAGGGRTTINPGSSNFIIYADSASTKPLTFNQGSGSDTISVGMGGGTVHAGTGGNSILIAGTDGAHGAATTLYGAASGDELYASGSTPTVLVAGAGNETLSGAGGTLNGTSFAASTANDTFRAGSGNDTMIGGSGSDTFYVNSAGDVVTEAANGGTDTVHSTISYTLPANVENLILDGSSNLIATGNAQANTITGNSGSDILNGAAGADTMVGGAGNDTYYVDNSHDVVTEAASGGTDTVHSTISYTLGANVEKLILDGTAAINGTGNALANALTGNAGANILNGEAGADTMAGGGGNDTYYVDNSGDVVTEVANGGVDTVHSTISYTLGANVENLILDGTAGLNGTGNTLANALTGNSGNNILNGGAGADTMAGGAGNDTYYVDNPGDIVAESANSGTDTVHSTISYTLPNNVENLILDGSAAINGTGNTLANVLTGNTGANILNGGAGADTMVGGAGNDTYYVDNSHDVVTEAANGGTDTMHSTISYTLPGNVENLILDGTAPINGIGNTLANVITGNSGNNVITTGAGADTVIIASAVFGADTITDFTAGSASTHDTLQFAHGIFASYADVLAHAHQVGANTVITYDTYNSITLQHVTLTSLTSNDFHFG